MFHNWFSAILIFFRTFWRTYPHHTFLWAVGLNIVNELLLFFAGKRLSSEPKKWIISQSRLKALQRCGVHILPCIISLVLITLHLRHHYMGKELNGVSGSTSLYMALLQVAAKTQELLIVASLATVIAHQLLSDLIKGPGVPYGFVGATSLFNQLQFFWSSTFLGSLRGFKGPLMNFRLLALVSVSGLIAATAGPAVAILLIPRVHTWNAGGSMYWINGTANDLWPQRVGLEHYMPELNIDPYKSNCTSEDAYTNPLCPSGGYPGLVQMLSSGGDREFPRISKSPFTQYDLLLRGASLLVKTNTWLDHMKPYFLIFALKYSEQLDTVAVAVHGPAAWVARNLGSSWLHAASITPYDVRHQKMRYKYFDNRVSIVNTSVPAVRVTCSPPMPLEQGEDVVQFPWIPDYDAASEQTQGPDSPDVRAIWEVKVEKIRNSSQQEFPKVSHVRLEDPTWTNSTIGVIVEFPWVKNVSRPISGCIVDARWAPGAVIIEDVSEPRPVLRKENARSDLFVDLFRPSEKSNWTQIDVTDEVFDAINFRLPLWLKPPKFAMRPVPENINVSAIEAYIYGSYQTNKKFERGEMPIVEFILASTFADALARVGVWRTPPKPIQGRVEEWQDEILKGETGGWAYSRPTPEFHDAVTYFRMEEVITGYAYKASEASDYLAIAVVLAHLLIATMHTIFLVFWKQESSGCWDTLPELLALVQQSKPSKTVLKNTATGIYVMSTYKKTVRVLVSEDDNEHVELSFDTDHAGNCLRRVDVQKKYG